MKSLAAVSIAVVLLATSCDKDPLTLSPEELAERIRANTPTELPPITTTGANTMGAYIHTDTGRVLFVASGVDRPETALAESLDCEAFNNFHYVSTKLITASGIYCARPEIGDRRQMNLSFGSVYPDSARLFFRYEDLKVQETRNYSSPVMSSDILMFDIAMDDRTSRILSGTFNGDVYNRAPPYDTLRITDGRFDVTYGITP